MKGTKRVLAIVISMVLVLAIFVSCSVRKNARTPQTATATAPSSAQGGRYEAGGQATNNSYMVKDQSIELTFSEDTADTAASAPEAPKMAESDGIRGTGSALASTVSTNPSLDILADRKVIRNANLSIEVDDFYHAYGNLQAMLNGIGYVSESNIHRDFYAYEGEKITRVSGDITIRVDARHFDNILNDVKGLGDVIDDRIYSNDVTDQFYDTEGRLKILKIEYEYLEEYMRSLNDPDSIFKTRMRMTELQTEIERLTGTLNKWSDLVELSTIYIQMAEKYPEELTPKKTNTYWDRMKNAMADSLAGIVDALGDLLIFIIEAIPTLVILGIIGLAGYKAVKKIIRKKKVPQSEVKEE